MLNHLKPTYDGESPPIELVQGWIEYWPSIDHLILVNHYHLILLRTIVHHFFLVVYVPGRVGWPWRSSPSSSPWKIVQIWMTWLQVSRWSHVPYPNLGTAPGTARDASHRKVPGAMASAVVGGGGIGHGRSDSSVGWWRMDFAHVWWCEMERHYGCYCKLLRNFGLALPAQGPVLSVFTLLDLSMDDVLSIFW